MKRGPQQSEHKSLFIANLIKKVKESFDKITPVASHRKITLSDCLMSALAMFSLKSPSLLAFDKQREEELVRHNLENLFLIENAPCDTRMREA